MDAWPVPIDSRISASSASRSAAGVALGGRNASRFNPTGLSRWAGMTGVPRAPGETLAASPPPPPPRTEDCNDDDQDDAEEPSADNDRDDNDTAADAVSPVPSHVSHQSRQSTIFDSDDESDDPIMSLMNVHAGVGVKLSAAPAASASTNGAGDGIHVTQQRPPTPMDASPPISPTRLSTVSGPVNGDGNDDDHHAQFNGGMRPVTPPHDDGNMASFDDSHDNLRHIINNSDRYARVYAELRLPLPGERDPLVIEEERKAEEKRLAEEAATEKTRRQAQRARERREHSTASDKTKSSSSTASHDSVPSPAVPALTGAAATAAASDVNTTPRVVPMKTVTSSVKRNGMRGGDHSSKVVRQQYNQRVRDAAADGTLAPPEGVAEAAVSTAPVPVVMHAPTGGMECPWDDSDASDTSPCSTPVIHGQAAPKFEDSDSDTF
eukprot:m.19455 g.19455  ORF g.19455 m.19455 type:complete len:437 (+) comp3695_c0_seq1:574-1884(+)